MGSEFRSCPGERYREMPLFDVKGGELGSSQVSGPRPMEQTRGASRAVGRPSGGCGGVADDAIALRMGPMWKGRKYAPPI